MLNDTIEITWNTCANLCDKTNDLLKNIIQTVKNNGLVAN